MRLKLNDRITLLDAVRTEQACVAAGAEAGDTFEVQWCPLLTAAEWRVSIARLLRAGLVDTEGDACYVTSRGSELALSWVRNARH